MIHDFFYLHALHIFDKDLLHLFDFFNLSAEGVEAMLPDTMLSPSTLLLHV